MKPLETALTQGRGGNEGLLGRSGELPIFSLRCGKCRLPADSIRASSGECIKGVGARKGKHGERVGEIPHVRKTKEGRRDCGESRKYFEATFWLGSVPMLSPTEASSNQPDTAATILFKYRPSHACKYHPSAIMSIWEFLNFARVRTSDSICV